MSNPPPVDVFFDGSKIFDLQSGGKNKKKQTKTPEGSILSPKQTKVSVAYRRFLFAKMLSLPPFLLGDENLRVATLKLLGFLVQRPSPFPSLFSGSPGATCFFDFFATMLHWSQQKHLHTVLCQGVSSEFLFCNPSQATPMGPVTEMRLSS